MFTLFVIFIYVPICYVSVRLFGKDNGLKGYRLEATLTVISLTPFLGIPLANYAFSDS